MPGKKNNRHRYHRPGRDDKLKQQKDASPLPMRGDWKCGDDYKYPITESPKDTWEKCNNIVDEYDEKVCKELKDEITFLMVVAGLFLSVVTAFTIDSYQHLREDKQDTMSDLLVEVVRLLNDTSTQGSAKQSRPFVPDHHDIVINQLWFLSMFLSLIAVLIGTYCLQWISAYPRTGLAIKYSRSSENLVLRQLRLDGMVSWGIHYAPDILLLLVQLSITLFSVGLLYFLWHVNHLPTIPIIVVAAIAGVSLCLANIMPVLQCLVGAFLPTTLTVPQRPYKSPTSWLLQAVCNVSFSILKPIIAALDGRLEAWWKKLPPPLTSWRTYDLFYADLRESWGSEYDRVYYMIQSVASAIYIEPNAANIILGHIQRARPTISHTEYWQDLLKQNLSLTEKNWLQGNESEYRFNASRFPKHIQNLAELFAHVNQTKHDFLNALVYQFLVQSHREFRLILLRHRVELYIRIKNSSDFFETVPGSSIEFGGSLHCPLDDDTDATEMDLELKFQFLICTQRLIGTRRFTDLDILGAATIIGSVTQFGVTFHRDDDSNPLETQGTTEPPGVGYQMPVPQLVEINEMEKPEIAGKEPSGIGALEDGKSTWTDHVEDLPEIECMVLPYKDQISDDEKSPEPRLASSTVGAQINGCSIPSETGAPAELEPRSYPAASAKINGGGELRQHSQSGTGPSIYGTCDLDASEPSADVIGEKEVGNSQLLDSLRSLCSQVEGQLRQLQKSDFKEAESYYKLRRFFCLPLDNNSPQPMENLHA